MKEFIRRANTLSNYDLKVLIINLGKDENADLDFYSEAMDILEDRLTERDFIDFCEHN